jgi:opacity protein-like surface antigen
LRSASVASLLRRPSADPVRQVRPFVVGGLGLLRTSVTSTDQFFDIANNDFGFDVGGGLYIFFNDRVGLRGDARYFRNPSGSRRRQRVRQRCRQLRLLARHSGVTFRF